MAALTWLEQQPGVTPTLRITEAANAERAAVELLLALDVEPRDVDPHRAVPRGGWL
jgi:hypothetical protein